MPRLPRNEQFDPNSVGIVHIFQRCVRRAYLAGEDAVSGKNYGHRREWIRCRMERLASVFGIDVLTYAILSNHLHIVVRTRPDVIAVWSDSDVALRWLRVFPGRRIDEQLADPTTTDVEALANNAERIQEIRVRLSNPSWFMKALCEPIARLANKQDEATGHFWEGRFKCQKLADETAILACSAYVDLNPVRAGVAEVPEESQYTSVYERIQAEKASRKEKARAKVRKRQVSRSRSKVAAGEGQAAYVRGDDWLTPVTVDERSAAYRGAMPSKSGKRASDKGFLGMSFELYLKLLDWTGRQIRRGNKKGRIPSELAPILERVGLSGELWCDLVNRFGKIFKRVAGTPESLAHEAVLRGQSGYRTGGSPLTA